MAQANAIYKEVFEKFYPKLAEVLPALFDNLVTNLRCKNLLPTYHEDNLNSLETNEGKSEYFLNNVIKSGLQIKYLTQFKEMLKVMRSSGDYAINCLVDDIENFIGNYKFAVSQQCRYSL